MTEVLSFPEGSAYIWTGNSTTSALMKYVRNVSISLNSGMTRYRPPQQAAWTYVPTGFEARLTLSQAYSDKELLRAFQNAGPGNTHFHIKNVSPAAGAGSGGWFLWTGTINIAFAGSEGQAEQTMSVDGLFEAASGY